MLQFNIVGYKLLERRLRVWLATKSTERGTAGDLEVRQIKQRVSI